MTLTRRESMLKALQDAGARGCTRRELVTIGGRHWKKHLARIEQDYYVQGHRSRYGAYEWRWTLGHERVEPNGETCDVPPQVHLFEPDRFARRESEPHWLVAA